MKALTLIKNKKLALSYNGASKRKNLSLTDGQVRPSGGNLTVERDPCFIVLL